MNFFQQANPPSSSQLKHFETILGRPKRIRSRYRNVLSLLRSVDELSVLVKALELTGLLDNLDNGGPFTIFAPVNDAFDRIGRDRMLSDIDR